MEETKVFIQISNGKDWKEPVLKTFERQSHVKPAVQLLSDVLGESVRVTYPTQAGLDEREDFEVYAKQLGGHYYRPT